MHIYIRRSAFFMGDAPGTPSLTVANAVGPPLLTLLHTLHIDALTRYTGKGKA
jgi:hypothetical protein